MGRDQSGSELPKRRDFLKATGAGVLATSLAGCDETPDLGDETTEGGNGTADGGATSTGDGGSDVDDPFQARAAVVNTEFTAEADGLVQGTFAKEQYTRIEGVPGVDAPEDVTPTAHALTYGHEGAALSGDPPDVPTVNALSAGTLSVPAPEEGAGTDLASAELTELVRLEEGNLLLAAAGLGTTVEWLTEPVPVDRGEATLADSPVETRTFLGVVRGEPGPRMPSGEEESGFLGGDGARPFGHLVAVHAARTQVGGDLVLTGMVDGFRRPPSMDPRAGDLGPDLLEEFGDLYEEFIRVGLFLSVVSEIEMAYASQIPDVDERDERAPDEEVVEESYSATLGVDDDVQVKLGYPDEEIEDETTYESFTVGRDMPPLTEEYDPEVHSPGTAYLLKAGASSTAYRIPAEDGTAVPFGVVASTLVEVEGEQRNPLATDSMREILQYATNVWDLMYRAGVLDDLVWEENLVEVDRVSGEYMLGESAEFVGFQGKAGTTSNGEVQTSDTTVYVARVLTDDEVVVAVGFSENGEGGHFDERSTVKGLFERLTDEVVFDPDPLTDWVDAGIDDLNLVQVCQNTRLETRSADVLQQPDPPLVEGRNTAAPFDVSTWSDTSFSGYPEPLRGVFRLKLGDRSETFETVLDSTTLSNLDQDRVNPDMLFDDVRQNGPAESELPVFELQDSDDSATLEALAPSGHQYESAVLQAGADYEMTDFDVLRVGFIPVVDPQNGKNYGDGNGATTDYAETVDAAFEYLKRTYPVGIAAYRHNSAIEGISTWLGNKATHNTTKDYRNARVALERTADPSNNGWVYTGETYGHKITENEAQSQIRSNGFDIWVLIVPDGYYQFHGDNRPAGLAPFDDNLAVTTAEGDRLDREQAAEVVAQELGHRIEGNPYENPTSGNGWSNPLAQRDDDGTDTGNRDFDHARHLSSDEDGDTPTDGPGVVSQAYSLAEGEFVVPSFTDWDGGFEVSSVSDDDDDRNNDAYDSYGPAGLTGRLGRMESFMSYSDRRVWADSLIARDIAESGFRREGGFQTANHVLGGLNKRSVDGFGGGGALEATELEVTTLEFGQSAASAPGERELANAEELIDVSMLGPDGETLATTQVPATGRVDGHDVENGELIGDTPFAAPFPPEAVEMVVADEGSTVRENPITRVIREAYGSISPEALAEDPEVVRERVEAMLATVEEAMASGDYAAARDEMQGYVEASYPPETSPEVPTRGNQYDVDRLGWLFETMIGRLDGLADGDSGGGDVAVGDPPAWADWVPAPSASDAVAGTRGLWQFDVSATVAAGDALDELSIVGDPTKNPITAGLFATLVWEELRAVGLDRAVLGEAARSTDVDPATVPAETGVLVDDDQVYLGSFDVDELDATVAAGPFSATDTEGVYRYEEGELFVAYGAEYVVVAQSAAEVATLRAAGRGELARWHEADEEVAWLFGAGAGGDFSLLTHQAEGTVSEAGSSRVDLSPFTDAAGVAQTTSLDGETVTDARAGVVYPEESAVELAALESTLATDAADRSFEQDGRFVAMSATYE